MDRRTAARHRLRWLLAVVLAVSLSQWLLPTAAHAEFGSGAPGSEVALTDAAPDVVTASRAATRLLTADAQPPGPEDHGPEPGLRPDAVVADGLAVLGVVHAADLPSASDPHPPTARDRAPPG